MVRQRDPKTILLVEDSPTQAMQTRALLMANGLRVLIATDGVEGVEMADRDLPGVVVLDWELPRMNGGDVVRSLKNNPNTRTIPIIILSRHDAPEIINMGLEGGAIDFIPKDTFAKIVLIETLRQMGYIETQSGSSKEAYESQR